MGWKVYFFYDLYLSVCCEWKKVHADARALPIFSNVRRLQTHSTQYQVREPLRGQRNCCSGENVQEGDLCLYALDY